MPQLNEVKLDETVEINGVEFTFKGFRTEKTRLGKQTVYVFSERENPKNEKTYNLSYQTVKIEKIEDGRYRWNK